MICVYEEEGLERLSPLAELRPVFDLRCGRFTLLEKVERLYPKEDLHLWVRPELAEVTAERHPGARVNKPVKKGRLFLSARAIFEGPVSPQGRESVLLAGDEVVGFRVCAECAEHMSSTAGLRATLAEEQVKAKTMKRPWDLVELTPAELEREIPRLRSASLGMTGRSNPKSETRMTKRGVERGAVVVGAGRLVMAKGATVWPGAVISTETGPVMLDEGAEVRPGSFVEGPCYIGPGTLIDGAKVRPGCSFGPQCRIGGEVEASVFQGHSNKHHEGYIGHSFVGEWVNLGALTTNSDLKNTYENVQVFFPEGPVDTGLTKVGGFFGDHAKTAIGSLFNTGCRVGIFANWFEPGLARKELAPFSWGRHGGWTEDAAVANARTVMGRRKVELSAATEALIRLRFRETAGR
jgi:UDP-N-acetylglucosamine diphosphorylase/glucosamine-1-phosphate N-acetyltransferase